RRVNHPLLQEGISRPDGPGVTLQDRQIGAFRLSQQEIQITPSAAGRAFDQLDVFAAKYDGPKYTQKLGQASNGAAIDHQVSFPGRPVDLEFVITAVMGLRADEKSALPVANHLGARHSTERSQRREKINRLKN